MSKAWGHHSDNRVHVIIEAHFAPDYVPVRTIIATPKAVADNDRLQESRGGILRRVDAAKLRIRSQHSKVIGTRDETFGTNRTLSTSDRRTTRRHGRDILKHAGAILQIPKLRCRHAHILLVWATKVVEDAHEFLWMREGQRPQQNAIHHAESRDIGANSQCKSQHCHGRKAGVFEQHSERIAQVLEE